MKLNLALAQINTRLGDVKANLDKHLALAGEARQHGADLLIFPELSLTGYVLQDLVPAVACRPADDDPTFAPLLEASHNIDLLVGFVEEDRRHRFYISAAYLTHGEVAHPDPYTATMQAVRGERVDEIIVSTFPGEKVSSWLRGNLVERLRKDTKVPVTHVEVSPAPAPAEAPGGVSV